MAKKETHDLSRYEVRRGRDGKTGIYLRSFNVRLAVFNSNSDHLQDELRKLFGESCGKVADVQEIEQLRRVIERVIPVLDMVAATDENPEYKSILTAAKAVVKKRDQRDG